MIYSRNDWNLKDSRRFFWLPQEILQNSANFSKKTKHVSLLLWFHLIGCSAQKTHSIIIFRFARIKFINLKLIFSFFSFCTAAISTVDKMPVLKPTIHWPQMRCWLPIVSVTQTWVSNSNTLFMKFFLSKLRPNKTKKTQILYGLYMVSVKRHISQIVVALDVLLMSRTSSSDQNGMLFICLKTFMINRTVYCTPASVRV